MNISGYVLAGGQSSRMGRDKALLRLGDHTLLEIAIHKVKSVCGNATILGGPQDRCTELSLYGRVLPDRVEQAGPLAALEAALFDTKTDWLFLMPVDLPLLPAIALTDLMETAFYYDQPGVMCYEAEGRQQPLPVVIHRCALKEVTRALDSGERRLMPVLQRFAEAHGELRFLILRRLREYDWFTNVNTPAEFQFAEEILRAGNEIQ